MSSTELKSPALDFLPAAIGLTAAGNVAKALQAIRSHLGMDVAFVSEFVDGQRVFRHVDAAESGSPIRAGDSSPLEEGYCQRVVDGRLPELMPDTLAIEAAVALPVTRALPVGAHLSVPIRLSDGRVYGTFCCFSFKPDLSLNHRDLQMMRAFAEVTGFQIEHDLRAKADGRERVKRIQAVIDQKRLSTVYQPIYHLTENNVLGFECLTRFAEDPPQPPDTWFSEASQLGMGLKLELAAAEMALAALPKVPADVYLAVNLSPSAILKGGAAAALNGLPLERIVLELTEHDSIQDYRGLVEVLDPLRAAGLRIAIDDVGAGYSSMRHILNLRPDLIKLDMSLTRDIDTDPARRALALALIGFAREMDCQIIAEGVETAGELAALRLLGVRKAQGYFLGRPMLLDDALRLAAEPLPKRAELTTA